MLININWGLKTEEYVTAKILDSIQENLLIVKNVHSDIQILESD